jgi:hypothetical protein
MAHGRTLRRNEGKRRVLAALKRVMGRSSGFKTQPSVYMLSIAPTARARCRGQCKQNIDKGEMRLETSAFVRPGRRTLFVMHVDCVSAAVARGLLGVYGSIERVPVSIDVSEERAGEARALLKERSRE